jgi:DnaD/phage-associated family protein
VTRAGIPATIPVDGEPFSGFPSSGRATVIPSLFFSKVLPEVTDPAELAVSIYVFFATGPDQARHRRPPFVTRRELDADGGLLRALSGLSGSANHEALERGLDGAVRRRVLIRASVRASGDDREEEIYVVNTPANYRALEALASSSVDIAEPLPAASGDAAPNIFALYEQNVGAITPLIADDLKDAESHYPAAWIEAAFREAAELNKRSWRYIERILKRWEQEGPSYEEPGRDTEREWLARRYSEGKRRAPGG